MADDEPIMASMAGRYATALFDLAIDSGQLETVEAAVDYFWRMLDDSEDLRRLVTVPVFSAEEQGRSISAVLAKAGISGIAGNFFLLITKNRRLFAVPDMIRAFKALCAHHRGEVSAEVASAHPLTATQMLMLKDRLRAEIGKDVTVTAKVDPALLGGLTVKLGSRMIDSSLRTKLNNLKLAMKEVS